MDIKHALRTALPLALAIACALPAQARAPSDSTASDTLVPVAATATDALAPGEFEWTPDAAPQGQVLVVVSIPEQRAYVYRGGTRIGVSTVSTGTDAHPTPTGVFEILQKKKMHHSNLYNDAPMPWMQRLTWDGIALHSGRIPGYPASHGCVRLPDGFAAKLFAETEKGGIVVIADENSHDYAVVHPGLRSPVDTYSGLPLDGSGGIVAVRGDGSAPGGVIAGMPR